MQELMESSQKELTVCTESLKLKVEPIEISMTLNSIADSLSSSPLHMPYSFSNS